MGEEACLRARVRKGVLRHVLVAVLMAVLKLGGALGTGLLFLKTAPTEPVAQTSEPAVGRQALEGRRGARAESDQSFARRDCEWIQRGKVEASALTG